MHPGNRQLTVDKYVSSLSLLSQGFPACFALFGCKEFSPLGKNPCTSLDQRCAAGQEYPLVRVCISQNRLKRADFVKFPPLAGNKPQKCGLFSRHYHSEIGTDSFYCQFPTIIAACPSASGRPSIRIRRQPSGRRGL